MLCFPAVLLATSAAASLDDSSKSDIWARSSDVVLCSLKTRTKRVNS